MGFLLEGEAFLYTERGFNISRPPVIQRLARTMRQAVTSG
jgi:hypothetical protein